MESAFATVCKSAFYICMNRKFCKKYGKPLYFHEAIC